MIFAIILFAVTYILMLALPKWRPAVAGGSAVLFVVTGMLPVGKVLPSIDFNVLLMIAGTMGTVALLIESKMPALLADLILDRVPNVKWAIIMLSLFAGLVSAFIDNVATVLMIAPIALAIAKKRNINPVGMIIAIAVSSNLQGAATLVGDTTSILLGGYAGMDFLDFFAFRGRPGIFWAVELGAIASALLLLVLFRHETGKVSADEHTKVEDWVPTWLMGGTVAAQIAASFIPGRPALTNGLICMAFMLAGVVHKVRREKRLSAARDVLREIDWATLGLLAGLFVVVGGITEMGVVDAVARLFA